MNYNHNDDEQHNAYSGLLNGTTNEVKKMEIHDEKIFLRKRYLVTSLNTIGSMFLLILRSNLSIAIVEMTSDRNVTLKNEVYLKKAEFDWDSKTKGFVLSVFAIGYLMGPFGGILARKYGGVTIFGLGIAVTAVLTIISPFLLKFNFVAYILARIFEGVFESLSVACHVEIFKHWAPPNERSRLSVFSYAGSFLGLALNYPLCGFLAFKYGWEALFFITGGFGLMWSVVWFVCTSNDPTTDRFMTKTEREYFKSIISKKIEPKVRANHPYPWKKMFTSKPFWALMNENFCFYWFQSFFSYCLPLYIKDTFNFNIQNIGFISASPALGGLVGVTSLAILFDHLRSSGKFSHPFLHRLFIAIGQLSCVLCFVYIGFWANLVESLILIVAARTLVEFADVPYHVLPIDMFFEYAGLVSGFGITAKSLALFLNPIVMGFFVADHSRSSWNAYFQFLSVFNIWSLIIFYFYGSGKLQEWAKPQSEDQSDEKKLEEVCSAANS